MRFRGYLALTFFVLVSITLTFTRADIYHYGHYGAEARCVYEDYPYYWQHHSHPDGAIRQPAYTSPYCLYSQIPTTSVQGHPTLYPLLVSIFNLEDEPVPVTVSYHGEYFGFDSHRLVTNQLLFTVFANALMVIISFLVVRDLYGDRASWIMVKIMSVLPGVFSVAENENLLSLLMLLSVYCLAKASMTNEDGWYTWFGVFTGLSIGAKYTGLILLPIGLFTHRDRRMIRSYAVALLVSSLFSNPFSMAREVLSPSGIGINSINGLLGAVNPYLVLLVFVVGVTLAATPRHAADKFFFAWLLVLAPLPYLDFTSGSVYRVLLLMPPFLVLYSHIVSFHYERTIVPMFHSLVDTIR